MISEPSTSAAWKLTPYKEGSIKEVLHVSCPLMISYLSGYLMLFIDRIILARLSNDAMNAATVIGLDCYIFYYGLIGIAAIVEVFVGKLNGAKEFSKMGEPVWQAIWLCVFSAIICIPLAWYGDCFLVSKSYRAIGREYYIISMLACPIVGISAAIGSFFIGQGKGYIVTIAVLFSNIINLILAMLLVFGFWIFPKLGINGAAIATFCSQVVQVLILSLVFFTKNNRIKFGTSRWGFNYLKFKEVLVMGLPNSLSHVLEVAAWSLLAHMLATVNKEQVTLFSIGQSLFILFAFFSEGLQKGVMAISSNFIGAKKFNLIAKNIVAANYIHLSFCTVLLLVLMFNSDKIIQIFFPLDNHSTMLVGAANISCLWVLLFFALEGLAWIRSAVLTSLGDVKFIMLTNIISIIVFTVLPIYILIVKTNGNSAISSWQLISVSSMVNLLVFYYRSKFKLSNPN